MWLLDVNLPTALSQVLARYGVECDTTVRRGWRQLTNGGLAATAARHGFRVLLTRDRGFGVSAAGILQSLPDFAVVVVTLPQVREAAYLAAFEASWQRSPIRPVPGTVVEWP